MNVVLLFPGQGSQKPGMARDLVDALPAARETFATVDAALGEPLSTLCFDGPAETLTLTHNAQPALLAHGAAVWAAPLPMKSIQLRFSSEAVWPGLRVMTNSSCVPVGTPVSGSETFLFRF